VLFVAFFVTSLSWGRRDERQSPWGINVEKEEKNEEEEDDAKRAEQGVQREGNDKREKKRELEVKKDG
jgi:hypothetical protein